MTQPADLITRALIAIGALAPGEPLEASLAQDAFQMLNMLLDSASNDSFTVTSINEIVAPVGGLGTSFTLGPTGTIVSAQRPLGINSAFVRVATIDYPVQVLNIEQYELIGLKQLNGPWPRALYYNSGTPNGALTLWPNPSAGELHMFCDLLFTKFATINDTVLLPQGYELWLTWGLAELMCPSYGKAAMIPVCSRNASRALGTIKSTNMAPMQTVGFDRALTQSRNAGGGWIMSGGF